MIGVIGLGVVGNAVFSAFGTKFNTVGYDKFGKYSDDEYFENLLKTDVLFVCVPTPTIDGVQDQTALDEVMEKLKQRAYAGIVCVKCTVKPGTIKKYSGLKVTHNPEFLTAAKPYEDFMAQKAVILSGEPAHTLIVAGAYRELLPSVPIHMYDDFYVTEIAKYYSNCFLAVKVTFANEIYDLCQKLGCDYVAVRDATLTQGLVAPNHTSVPGPDGKTGFGLGCFPKDTLALLSFCQELGLKQEVLQAAIEANKRRRTFDATCKEV